MKMIVGLGNPGKKYDKTRHNVGFDAVDVLAESLGVRIDKKEGRSLTASTFYQGQKLLLAKPQTFMNSSGEAVWELIRYYGDSLEDFLIIYDDLDLPVGQMRFRRKGSGGGHNGIKSIIHMLHSQEFDRLKIGIDRRGDVISHVLSPFSREDRQTIDESLMEAKDAVLYWAQEGIGPAMNQFN